MWHRLRKAFPPYCASRDRP